MTRKISAIKVQKKDQNRVSIYLDGEYVFGLTRITAAWLTVGQELTEEQISRLSSEDDVEVAYLRALKFLSYKPRSAAEVSERLRKYEYSEQIIEMVHNRLVEKEFVNDHQFADMWVENRNTFRPRSHRVLRWELRNKKISEETISSILDETDTEEKLAMAAAIKYLPKVKNCERDQFYRRLAGYLGRRGFSYSITAPILAELWETTIQTKINYEKSENEVKNGE